MGLPPQQPPPTPSSFSPFGPFATLHAAAPPGRDGSTADSFPFDDSRDEKQKEWILEIIKNSDLVSEKAAQHDETFLAQVAEEEEGSAHNLGTLPRPILDFLSVLKGRAQEGRSEHNHLAVISCGSPGPQKLDVQLERVIAAFGNRKLIPKHIKEKFAAAFTKESFFERAPLNSSGYGDRMMYALGLPPSLRARDEGSSWIPTFYLDSGATHHMVSDSTILTNLRDPPAGMVVTVADGSEYPVTKAGDIDAEYIKIKDVNVVPGLEMNLVSVRQLAQSNIFTTFYRNHAELWQEGTEIGGALLYGLLYGLYFLQAP